MDFMATIQVRDLDPNVVESFRQRAAADGKSLQQYMKEFLTAAAPAGTNRELFAEIERVARATRTSVTLEDLVADVRELRDAG
jgi:plasmid stability protein